MQTNPNQFRPGYNPEDPGEGAIPRDTQLGIVSAFAYAMVAALGLGVILLVAVGLFMIIPCHSLLGIVMFIVALPCAWAFIATLFAANEIARGDLD